jgi:hypothetical protein
MEASKEMVCVLSSVKACCPVPTTNPSGEFTGKIIIVLHPLFPKIESGILWGYGDDPKRFRVINVLSLISQKVF